MRHGLCCAAIGGEIVFSCMGVTLSLITPPPTVEIQSHITESRHKRLIHHTGYHLGETLFSELDTEWIKMSAIVDQSQTFSNRDYVSMVI